MLRMICSVMALTWILSILPFGVPTGFAEPTPPDRKLAWDQYDDPLGTGFWLYYAPEGQDPREYTDANRIQITDVSQMEVTIVDLNPPPPGGNLCFKLTAHDGQDRESDFSNEDCGWFGLKKPGGLQATP